MYLKDKQLRKTHSPVKGEAMKIYRPKALIPGYKIGPEFKGKTYVAVPQKKVERKYYVAFGNKLMATFGKEPATRLKFQDHYGRGAYWLYYYEWKVGKLVIAGDII